MGYPCDCAVESGIQKRWSLAEEFPYRCQCRYCGPRYRSDRRCQTHMNYVGVMWGMVFANIATVVIV